MASLFDLPAASVIGQNIPFAEPGQQDQFRLTNIQCFNWGTFDKLRVIAIAPEGHLVLGPSGSGKSTLLDGHTSLLTKPQWVDFNTAARATEKGAGDRSLVTYVRGAWATQTSEEGERVKRFLRTGTTWSALAETYQDATGRTVVLGRILWIKGNGVAEGDVHRLYFTAERPFSLLELEFFPQEGTGFEVRRLKQRIPDVDFKDEFSGYQAKFMRLFGINSEGALRLLHKTQSAKDLGDLNKFLRDFMLDPPETFRLAETLVNEFGVLNSAHEAVLTARLQIEALKPVRDALGEHARSKELLSLLAEEQAGVEYWREQRRRELLNARIGELTVQGNGLTGEITSRRAKEEREQAHWTALVQLRAGSGGATLEALQAELVKAEQHRLPEVTDNDRVLRAAVRDLDYGVPTTPQGLAEVQAQAQELLDQRHTLQQKQEEELDALKDRKRKAEERFVFLRDEIRAMERRSASSIPGYLQGIRERMAAELDIPEDDLPFAGELMQVKSSESKWTGAAERVLGGFATSLLVEERFYREVADWVNRTHLGNRLFFLRMSAREGRAVGEPAGNSLVRKLDLAPKHRDWISEQLRSRFDYACVEGADELRSKERAVTLAGQIKHGAARHEKDDRKRIDDRSNWVMGFSNEEKLKAYKDEAAALAGHIDSADRGLAAARERNRKAQDRLIRAQELVNLKWDAANLAGLLDEIQKIKDRINDEKKAHPELAELDSKITRQKGVWDDAKDSREAAELDLAGVIRERDTAQQKLKDIPADALMVNLTPIQQERLQARFEATGKKMTPEQIDSASSAMVSAISREQLGVNTKLGEMKANIETMLLIFCQRWPVMAGGLDPKLEAAPDFMSKLNDLEKDRIHEYEKRFKDLLWEQSHRNLAVLHQQLDEERRSIQDRMDQVNESLRQCAFNENTYLQIDYHDKPTQEVLDFRAQLKASLSHSFKEDDFEEMERRFAALNAVVQRLGSQETANKKWRDLVLDVRQHVVFSATEFDRGSKMEVETYDSGAGKSGGQRQKLTTTCLAAALRYQLAGEEGMWPTYSTVVMDEAFDRADNEFTGMVMKIFKSFGFQVVAATPLKNVMALEPFIGGGTYVNIRDRRHSEVLALTYVKETNRLDLPLAAQEEIEAAETAESSEA